jgi:hypothetical protein
MPDTDTAPKAKPKYSKPIVVDLSSLGAGTGIVACSNGSAAAFTCSTGASAGSACLSGTAGAT